MAINWDIKISNVNVQSKRANVTFTRTDTESTGAPKTYSFANTYVETPEQRISLLNTVKQEVENDATRQADIDILISDLEQAGKSNLETWETTR